MFLVVILKIVESKWGCKGEYWFDEIILRV